MNVEQLKLLLETVATGQTRVDDAMARLRSLPFENLPFATVDHHRALRCGQAEVIFCQGKTREQVVRIAERLAEGGTTVLGTRADDGQRAAVRDRFPAVEIHDAARAFVVNPRPPIEGRDGGVLVISAGTADFPVAEEALVTLRAFDVAAEAIRDVGVAGLHRLLPHVPAMQKACAIVVAAGMEGALPSVIGGLVACPVFAVPTSVGYGASFGGIAALLGMLNSCSSNVSVVNIDNGFGAAYSAAAVYRQVKVARDRDKEAG